MNILRKISTTIAIISVMVTVESCATGPTILEATPHELVILVSPGNKSFEENIEDTKRLGAGHCKKFGKVAGKISMYVNLNSTGGEFTVTVPCV